jgi:hypothetical protein
VDNPNADWSGNPNSAHQRWSQWTFDLTIRWDGARRDSILDNARRFFRQMFQTTAGRVRVERLGPVRWQIKLQVEGVDCHDPGVRQAVEKQFRRDFLARGFGRLADLTRMDVALLAGTREDGTPSDQLIVLPPLSIRNH